MRPLLCRFVEVLIRTPRLLMRPLHAGDLDGLYAMYGDAEVMRFIGSGDPASREQTAEALLTSMAEYERDGYGLLATIERDTGCLVGRCGFKRWQVHGKDQLEIGWMIATEHQGCGLATEAGLGLRDHAFDNMGWDRVISVIQPDNAASIKVARKVGAEYWRDWTTPGGQKVVLYRAEAG